MWMTRNFLSVKPTLSVVTAAGIMSQKRVRRLPVVEEWPEGLHLLGIISTRDVIHAFPSDVNPFAIEGPDARVTRTVVSEIMTVSPRTVTAETPIETAAAMMCEHKIGALPVMKDKIIVGIISESDIFRAFVSLFGSDEAGARITFDVTKGEDVFTLVGKLARHHQMKILSLIWTQHDQLPVCVVRVAGANVGQMLDELWSSGHAVMNVIRFPS
jgi:acetoin utilization protein AcuB